MFIRTNFCLRITHTYICTYVHICPRITHTYVHICLRIKHMYIHCRTVNCFVRNGIIFFSKKAPPFYTLAGFDLTTHNFAGGDVTTQPGQGLLFMEKLCRDSNLDCRFYVMKLRWQLPRCGKVVLYMPWRRGVLVIVSVAGAEDCRFESRQGVCKVYMYTSTLILIVIVFEWNVHMSKNIFKN
jgi:hypothetical protein